MLKDARGPVLRYVDVADEDTRIADRAAVVPGRGPDEAAAAAIADPHLRGWLLTTDDSRLSGHLVKAGGAPRRHAVLMRCDLRAIEPSAPCPVGLVPGALPASDDLPAWESMLPSWRHAFPPDHPDHFAGDDRAALAFLRRLVDGTELGPLHRSSLALHSHDGRALAGVLVNVRGGEPPWGGPWIADIWRDPDLRGRGAGTFLISHVQHALATDGFTSVTLKVTHGNPARRSYERAGFRVVVELHTVALPGSPRS